MTQVVAALIWRNGTFLIGRRPPHKTRGLLWEFIGGKVEDGETKEEALVRECREEIGAAVVPKEVFMEVEHAYPDLTVHLTLFTAELLGEARLLEHAELRWITPSEIDDYAFCPADEVILARLKAL